MKLAWDSNQFKVSINHIDLHISPENLSPFPVQAIIQEQDTSLVLEPDDELRDPGDDKPLWYDANKIDLLESHQPGDVIIKSFNPMYLLAIVHNLDLSPSWKTEWIETALSKALAITEEKGISAIRLPVIGAQYGHFELDKFIDILKQAANKNEGNNLKKIWLVVAVKDCQLAFNLLEQS